MNCRCGVMIANSTLTINADLRSPAIAVAYVFPISPESLIGWIAWLAAIFEGTCEALSYICIILFIVRPELVKNVHCLMYC